MHQYGIVKMAELGSGKVTTVLSYYAKNLLLLT
jgi:hypothetical protein